MTTDLVSKTPGFSNSDARSWEDTNLTSLCERRARASTGPMFEIMPGARRCLLPGRSGGTMKAQHGFDFATQSKSSECAWQSLKRILSIEAQVNEGKGDRRTLQGSLEKDLWDYLR